MCCTKDPFGKVNHLLLAAVPAGQGSTIQLHALAASDVSLRPPPAQVRDKFWGLSSDANLVLAGWKEVSSFKFQIAAAKHRQYLHAYIVLAKDLYLYGPSLSLTQSL
jgi:hypothetical protein